MILATPELLLALPPLAHPPPEAHGKHWRPAKGYAAIPGSGPAAETCATCASYATFGRYRKCLQMKPAWTGGRATDILARSPACKKWIEPL